MSLPRWKLSVCVPILFASAVLAAAQSAPASPRSASTDETTTAALWPAPSGPAPHESTGAAGAQILWDDAHIKDFIGLSENAWDFTDPNGVPGFGPLPQASKMSLVSSR